MLMQIFLGVNKVHYGQCGSGESWFFKANLHCYNKLTFSRWKCSLKLNYPKNNWKYNFSVQKMDMNIAYFSF